MEDHRPFAGQAKVWERTRAMNGCGVQAAVGWGASAHPAPLAKAAD